MELIKTHRFACNTCALTIDYMPGIYYMPNCPVCGEPMESTFGFLEYSISEYIKYIDSMYKMIQSHIEEISNQSIYSKEIDSEQNFNFDDNEISQGTYCPLIQKICNESCKFYNESYLGDPCMIYLYLSKQIDLSFDVLREIKKQCDSSGSYSQSESDETLRKLFQKLHTLVLLSKR